MHQHDARLRGLLAASANLIGGMETAQRKCGHVAQQRDETGDLVLGSGSTLLGRRLARVADGAVGMEILGDPAERVRRSGRDGELCLSRPRSGRVPSPAMCTSSRRNDSISQVSISPALIHARLTASYIPSGGPNQQWV
jgi:hypothetical protein